MTVAHKHEELFHLTFHVYKTLIKQQLLNNNAVFVLFSSSSVYSIFTVYLPQSDNGNALVCCSQTHLNNDLGIIQTSAQIRISCCFPRPGLNALHIPISTGVLV